MKAVKLYPVSILITFATVEFFLALQYHKSISNGYSLVIESESSVSDTPLLSLEYVLVLLKRYKTSQLSNLSGTDPPLVQVSLLWLEWASQAIYSLRLL